MARHRGWTVRALMLLSLLVGGSGVAAAGQSPSDSHGSTDAPPPQAKGSKSRESPWAIDLGVTLNRVASTSWWDVTPSVSRALDKQWTIEFGAPVRFVPGALAQDGLSHAGIGDIYGTLTFEHSTDDVTFNSALWVSAATGSTANGLGTGETAWDWTNHVEKDFGNLTPYTEVGFSNSVDYATRVSRNVVSGLSGATAASTGILFNGEVGVELTLSDSASVLASGYLTRGVGSQTLVTRPTTIRRGPSRGSVVLTSTNAGDDGGFTSTFRGQVARGVDVEVAFWRSTTYQYNSLSVGMKLNLVKLLKP